MNNLIIALLFTVSAGIFDEGPKDRSPYTPPTRDEVVENVKSSPSNKNINAFLAELLGATSYARGSKDYLELQQVAFSIPNLSARLGERIQECRPSVSGRDLRYDQLRQRILLRILPNLPSPETIMVFGNFLSDERDVGEEFQYPEPQANCDYATNGLRKIGLRGYPDVGRTERWDKNHMEDLGNWRSWWSKVKSGQLAFSFEGQDVEYRFKPDGTWIEGPLGTTTPKDRATHSATGELRNVKRGEAPVTANEEASPVAPKQSNRLPWFVAVLLSLLGGAFYIFKIRTRAV